MESLRKECDAAKKKAKDTLEKYFSESDRLKAIIDEQQGILTVTVVVEARWPTALGSGSSGPGSSPGRGTLRCVLAQDTLLHSASLHPGV